MGVRLLSRIDAKLTRLTKANIVPSEEDVSEKDGKVCPRCGQYKPFSAFNKKTHSVDGYQNYCRDCIHEYQKVYRNNKKQ